MIKQTPRIESQPIRNFIGINIKTSITKNKTHELWSRFMPRKKEIKSVLNNDLFSLQQYPIGLEWRNFGSGTIFTKWAAVQVSTIDEKPRGMNSLIIPASKCAVFIHKGPVSTFDLTTNYIYLKWLPTSDYDLNDLPHFEVMSDKYLGHQNLASEEELWIPIK